MHLKIKESNQKYRKHDHTTPVRCSRDQLLSSAAFYSCRLTLFNSETVLLGFSQTVKHLEPNPVPYSNFFGSPVKKNHPVQSICSFIVLVNVMYVSLRNRDILYAVPII